MDPSDQRGTQAPATELPSGGLITADEYRYSLYPRPRYIRVLRWVLRLWWLAFALYPANALFNLYSLVGNQGFGALRDPSVLAQALLLTQLLQVVIRAPAVALPPLVAVAALILLGRWAHRDAHREQLALAKREAARVRERELQAAREVAIAAVPAAVAQQLDADARHAAKGAPPSPPLQPQGPPFDEHLLPLPPHIVGRGDDLTWVLGRLQRRPGAAADITAITALGGMGGIGKTTLAALAVQQARAENRFPDGIAVVLCQELTDPAMVLRRVHARFDPYRKEPEASELAGLAETTIHTLRGKRALVVLDNIEPGLDLAATVGPLRAAGLAVLLTARQALPRTVVPVEASRTLELLSPEEAVELFADAYGRRRADALSPAEHAAAERIVAALGRHTLAVKLAGAYAADLKRDLGVLAHELEQDPLEVPDGETPRGVALVLARSTETLSPDARRLFAALAAFATPEFGRQAALALATALGYATPEALLNLLVLRALLEASTNDRLPKGSDRERLRLHPLLRAFAERLFARRTESEREAAAHAVCAYFARYVDKVAQTALVADEGNIRGVLEWLQSQEGQDELLVMLCDGMRQFWAAHARTQDGLRYLPNGIAAAAAIAESTGAAADRRRLARLMASSGEVLLRTGKSEEAEATLREVLAICRDVQDRQIEGQTLARLGEVVLLRGEPEEAEAYLQQALAIAREVQDRQSEGEDLFNLGHVALLRGRLEEAEATFREALAICRDVQDRQTEGHVLASLGQAVWQRGRLEEAATYVQQGLAIHREAQDRQGESVDLASLGELARLRGRLEEAEDYFQQALAAAREVQDRQGEGENLASLGHVALLQERWEETEECYQQALVIHREVQDRRWEATTLSRLAELADRRGEDDQAEALYHDGLSLARQTQNGKVTARILFTFGRFLIQRRDRRTEGCAMLQEAVALFAQMGMTEEQEAREYASQFGCSSSA